MSEDAKTPGPAVRLPKLAHRGRRSEDTAAGCRTLAAASLASAALAALPNGRSRFEQSAAAWSQRAQMIQRLDESFEARRTAAAAMWAEEEPSGRGPGALS